jgi:enoyl-CoA hydratase/carnithine racemase
VRSLAETVADGAPLTLKAIKAAIGEGLKDESRRNRQKLDDLVAACFTSADYKEGRTAFMEKRRPQFRGV